MPFKAIKIARILVSHNLYIFFKMKAKYLSMICIALHQK